MKFFSCKIAAALCILCSLAAPRTYASGPTEYCDMPGGNVDQMPAKDATSCAQNCVQQERCRGYVFISGWNRCFLKEKAGRTTKVRMYSGTIQRNPSVPPAVTQEGYDLDHKAKDWQKKIVKRYEECREVCLATEGCDAFTMIEGYDTCWLKKGQARLQPKIFYCGSK